MAVKSRFDPRSLDAVNFLLSDVRGALGPYLNVFLVTQQHWTQSQVGMVTTVSGLIGLSLQTPIGAAIDETRAKRGVVVLALAVLAAGAVVIFAMPRFWPVAIANTLVAVAGDVFAPAVAALTLGLYTRPELARRMGRNSAYDHAGNVAVAAIAGAVGYFFSQRAVFLLARSSRCSPPPRCCPFPPPPSITSARAIWKGKTTAMKNRPASESCFSPACC